VGLHAEQVTPIPPQATAYNVPTAVGIAGIRKVRKIPVGKPSPDYRCIRYPTAAIWPLGVRLVKVVVTSTRHVLFVVIVEYRPAKPIAYPLPHLCTSQRCQLVVLAPLAPIIKLCPTLM